MPLPDFLVIGAPKAGTTALHAALDRHPALYLSPVKEPKFFLTDGPPPTRGGGPGDVTTWREHVWRREDYEALFAPAAAGLLRGESTPFYLYDRQAQRRIRELIPSAKLIAILRDPVERAHSNWAHLWSAGLDPEGDFVRACADEDRRIAAGWAQFWHYTRLGRYGEQLEHLYLSFPREQVLVLRYRDLVDAPTRTLDRICTFLGVPPGVVTEVPKENVTAHPAETGRHRVVSQLIRGAATVSRHLPGTTGARADRPAGADAAARRPAPPAAHLAAAAGRAALLRNGHPAAGEDHRVRFQPLAAAPGAVRGAGRGPAGGPVAGAQRPAPGVIGPAGQFSPVRSSVRSSCEPSGLLIS